MLKKIPDKLLINTLVSINKYKGDIPSCSNYVDIKLMSHIMELCGSYQVKRMEKTIELEIILVLYWKVYYRCYLFIKKANGRI